jgi:LysR family transcriptional regulator, glycine cleavage system transcriptional activator
MTLARRHVPDFSKLQAFESAARHGSFTGAAKELGLTQSALSRQIKELELQFGVALFERVRQRVVVSSPGRRFLPEARRLLDQLEQSTLRVMSSPTGTVLSLATLPTFGTRWLIPRLPAFLALNPGITLNLASHSKPFDLDEYSFDAAIHYGIPVWAQATCRLICQEEIVPVASPHFLARHPAKSISDMRSCPLLHLDSRPSAWSEWFQSAGAGEGHAFQGHRFDQFNMIIEAAIQGLGLALVPQYLIEKELAGGSLKIVISRSFTTENKYYLAVPNRELENPLIECFYDWLIGQVSRSPAPA